jgi:hypothetical protein
VLARGQGEVEGRRRFAEDGTTAGRPASGAGLAHNAHVPGRQAERLAEEMPEGGVCQQVAPLEVRRLQGVGAPTFDVVEGRRIDAVVSAGVEEPQVQRLARDSPRVLQPRVTGDRVERGTDVPVTGHSPGRYQASGGMVLPSRSSAR